MKQLAIALVAGLICLPALADGTPVPSGKAPSAATRGKPSAPVKVDARLSAGSATVTIVFLSAARDVDVHVHGVDGLSVTSAETPISSNRFAKGQSATFDVAFTPGPGRSNLVIAVNGTFGAAKRSSVVSFAVGTPTAEQTKSKGTVTTDSRGERIKTLPADTK